MFIRNTSHKAQFDWGDVFVQGGDKGIVGTKDGHYWTAFVEAFPKNPSSFIRGEGATVAEAEKSAWEQYQQIINCKKHEFEKRGYKNGAGFCKHCNLFKSDIFEPSEKCVICNCNTYHISDKDGKFYCKEHEKDIPEDKMWEFYKNSY